MLLVFYFWDTYTVCNSVCVCVADPMPVWQRPLSAVSMLPQRKQLHSDPSHLRPLPAAGRGRGLCDADAWYGGAAEEGMCECVCVTLRL